MRILLPIILVALALTLALPKSKAATDSTTPPGEPPIAELIVIEVEGCIYCKVFRRDVLPAYMASSRGKEAPIRFVDYNEPAAAELPLNQPVRIVPTFIMLKQNKEVGRIPGYVGRAEFFRAVTRMLYAP
jgi:thioredoxin-related protein